MFIISYDIRSDKVRKKLADFLNEKGLFRVQKSVFEGDVSNQVLAEIKAFISSRLGKNDSVRYYRLCGSCMIRIEHQGKASVTD